MQTVDFVGTVSRATMRYEDLIPAFLTVLSSYWPERAVEIEAEYAEDDWPHGSGLILDEPFSDAQEELSPWLLEDLADALSEIAPEDYYFGSSKGDGSDFGFWPITEASADMDADEY